MLIYGRLALRNIFRNRIRTLITLLMIGSGCMAMIIASGFIEDTIYQLREATIRDVLGHLRVYKKGFLTDGLFHPYDYMITDIPEMRERISAMPHVVAVGPRLSYYGLIGNGDATLPFVMQAFDPSLENHFRNTTTIVGGRFIEPGKPFDVMLGEGLARTMGLRVGDTPVLLGNTQRGGVNAMDVSVAGIFRTVAKDFDDAAIRAPIQLAQKMLRVDGAQMMIVFLDDTRRSKDVKQALLDVLGGEKGGYEVQAWYQLPEASQITATENVYRSIYRVMKVVLFLFVILSIMNTMNMAVLERIGEIGTLMALGTPRRGILKLFLVEGIILGLWGGLAGCFFGGVVAWAISAIGIRMPTPPGTTINWIAHIALTPGILGSAFSMALVTSLISSVLPAMKASRLDLAEALRHNI